MAQVLVLQHAESEGLGSIQDALLAAGATIRTIRGDLHRPIPTSLDGIAALIVMGGPMGVYEQDRYPFLAHELHLIQSALRADMPILGICLGSQLLAAALGSLVRRGPRKEVGWHAVHLSPDATADALFADAPERFQGFHWHGDVFNLPEGAVNLARSELTECQAFRHGLAYGILFHMEVTPTSAAGMMDAFPEEMAEAGVSKAALTEGNTAYLPQLQEIGSRVFKAWAAHAKLGSKSKGDTLPNDQ